MLNGRKNLRADARKARSSYIRTLTPEQRATQEAALADIILPHLGPPGILGAYVAVGGEISVAPTVGQARALGWEIAWPRVQEDAPLSFHPADEARLAPGHRGIPEPPANTPPTRPDLLLVPLVAADLAGNRLGQGGGHYDRTLAVARSHGPILAIGVCWDVQIVDSLPIEAWDQPLDAIATPTGFHPVARRGR